MLTRAFELLITELCYVLSFEIVWGMTFGVQS